MNCESTQRLMYEAVDRTLAPDERNLVDTHLNGCERCRAEMAVLDALIETVETTPPAEPSDAFLANVMASLHAPEPSPGFAPSVVFPRVAFAATLVAAALIWLYREVFAEIVENFLPVQAVIGPVATVIGDLQAYVQTQVASAASSLPEPVSTSVDWGSLLLVVTTLVVGYVLVRAAETMGVGNPHIQVGKRP
jgi:anti-sigma factor RsiW